MGHIVKCADKRRVALFPLSGLDAAPPRTYVNCCFVLRLLHLLLLLEVKLGKTHPYTLLVGQKFFTAGLNALLLRLTKILGRKLMHAGAKASFRHFIEQPHRVLHLKSFDVLLLRRVHGGRKGCGGSGLR